VLPFFVQFDIITIFPKLIEAECSESIIAKAIEKGLISVNIHDLRQWTADKRHTVDDRIFGGGPGMLLQLEPIYRALKAIGVYPTRPDTTKVLLTSAKGVNWSQNLAQTYADTVNHVVIICGRYEGVDHRVVEHLIDGEVSIGNYVLTGGELAANVILDSTARLLPGVLGNTESLIDESHSGQNTEIGEYPQYSRPAEFATEEGPTWNVPEVLLSGNHQQIADWRKHQRKQLTHHK
jgi:tRNA (guanine37-N1)-methyltransferase